jgi:hypothetical protein
MDKTTKRRLAELETRVGSKTPVVNLRVVFVAPPNWDDETRKQREKADASTAGQS